ncbi:hypothetical protein [Halobaculum sp. D14]|uniref:hypothetical protein n=1 Tax=unclassified Halobaculum TaxID=2640896 RepID=UPI003EC00123
MSSSTTTIRMTDRRESVYDALKDATGETTKSGALDVAAEYYIRMRGENRLQPGTGRVQRLLTRAVEQGSLTAPEIAELLDCEEFAVDCDVDISCGNDE